MSAWYIRKAKALLWYWLNFHPAETFHTSPLEALEEGYSQDPSFYSEQDLIVKNSREFVIGSCSSERFYIVLDRDSWHDVNKAVERWLCRMTHDKYLATVDWLKEVKGKPLASWHSKYTLAESPSFEGLVDALRHRRILNGDD